MNVESAPPPETPRGARDETGLMAILGRIAFLSAVVLLLIVSLGPTVDVRVFYSHHVSHFAAFYVTTFAACAGLKRTEPYLIWIALIVGGALVEICRVILPGHASAGYFDWVADSAGSLAAVAPLYLQDFRKSFRTLR